MWMGGRAVNLCHVCAYNRQTEGVSLITKTIQWTKEGYV